MIESFNGYRRNDDYLRDVSRGGVVGAEPFYGYGKRVTSGAESNVLWPDGTWVNPPASGVQMSLVSTSADDAAAGTGIRSIEIHCILDDLSEYSEVVTLNGITPVNTVSTKIRFIQCMHLHTYGSGKKAAGAISATNSGNTHAQITAGSVRCESSLRMVPAGKRLLITSFSAGSISGTGAAATIVNVIASKFFTHDYSADSIFIPNMSTAVQDNNTTITLPIPASFEEGVIVGMSFSTDKSATVVGAWFGWLENA